MKRVLILVENLPVPFDRRVWQEACALRDAGYAVAVICPSGHGHEQLRETIDAIEVYRYRLPTEGSGGLGYAVEYLSAIANTLWLSLRLFVTRGFDVIHACNPPDLFFLVGGVFKLFGVKFIFDHHDLAPELYVAKFGRRDWLYRLLLRLERWTFRIADVSIATNDSYRRIAITRGGMAPDRVFVVRSGPSVSRLKQVPPAARLKCGRQYLVGYVGVMGKQDGVHVLLQAARDIVVTRGRCDVHFGLVGSGTSFKELKALAQELGIADYVTFTGRVPDEQLLLMLNTADVCVNPDVANELNDKSTMNKVLEYMALGKPIVQFESTEGRLSAQGASVYATKNDPLDLAAKIVELLSDPHRRAVMGSIGRRRIDEQLEWRHQVPRLLAAYAALWSPATRPVVAGGTASDQ